MNNKPPNLSQSKAGYNTQMFPNNRAVCRAFRILGYTVSSSRSKISKRIVVQFQKDYNKCSCKFNKWGHIEINGQLNKETLNAVEIALRWTKKQAKKEGLPEPVTWQNLCKKIGDGRGYSATDKEKSEEKEKATNYIEVLPNGQAKLRNIYNDRALRADILDFEKHGPVIMAVAILPPQADLPNGKNNPITCPCVFGCC